MGLVPILHCMAYPRPTSTVQEGFEPLVVALVECEYLRASLFGNFG